MVEKTAATTAATTAVTTAVTTIAVEKAAAVHVIIQDINMFPEEEIDGAHNGMMVLNNETDSDKSTDENITAQIAAEKDGEFSPKILAHYEFTKLSCYG